MSVNTFSVNLTCSVGITLKALHITVGNCMTGGSVRVLPDTPVHSGYSLADAPKRRDAASTLINVVSCGKGQIGAHSHGGRASSHRRRHHCLVVATSEGAAAH